MQLILNKEIKSRRKERRLSQERLAELAGVSISFIKSLESGRSNIRLDLLLRVLGIFGLKLEFKGL